MKLEKLFDGFVENIRESRNFRAPLSKWINVNGDLERILVIEDIKIIVTIEDREFILDSGKHISFLNIKFESIDENGKRITTATGLNKYGSRIIGAVSNALLDKVKDLNYEALTFIAKDRIDTRIKIYNRIVKNDLQYFGKAYNQNLTLKDGSKVIIVYKDAHSDWHEEFNNWLKTQDEI